MLLKMSFLVLRSAPVNYIDVLVNSEDIDFDLNSFEKLQAR